MKNTTIAVIFVLVLLAVGVFFFARGNLNGNAVNTNNGGTNNNGGNGEVQKVVISYKNYNYYPQTITVKTGVPVSISLDNSVKGCFRSFNIRDLGLSKYMASPSDTMDFTPKQKGTYRFACGMGMGYGTLIVE